MCIRDRNIWVKVESYDQDTDEFLGEWKNEDYVDKTNDLTYRLESQVQHRDVYKRQDPDISPDYQRKGLPAPLPLYFPHQTRYRQMAQVP